MSGDKIASFGVRRADPDIPWPARGSGDTSLADRPGWERRTIPVTKRGKPETMEAMCGGQLAVNVMLEGEGIAICLAASGWRISHGGRVFARCADAMVAAEELMREDRSWTEVQTVGLTSRQRELLDQIIGAAEARGEILLDQVFPA